jgi:hypothetical protein
MTKVLQQADFVDQIEELATIPFNITSSRGKPTLEQTKRNLVRAELLDSLAAYLSSILDGTGATVFRVADGIAIEVSNDLVYAAEQDNGLSETTNGTMVVTFDATMQSLEYDAYQASLDWEEDVSRKAAAAAERARREAAKAARKQAAADKKQD